MLWSFAPIPPLKDAKTESDDFEPHDNLMGLDGDDEDDASCAVPSAFILSVWISRLCWEAELGHELPEVVGVGGYS